MKKHIVSSLVLLVSLLSLSVQATCRDAVVLVHGNTASPDSWDNTYNKLLSEGYSSSDIYRPNWGSNPAPGAIITVVVKKHR